MRWPVDVATLLGLIEADSGIQGVLGSSPMKLYKHGERELGVPSAEYLVIVEVPIDEAFHELQIQFDTWVRSEADLETIETALYLLFHKDTEWTAGSQVFRSQLLSTRPAGPEEGVYHGSVDYSFTVVRQRYH